MTSPTPEKPLSVVMPAYNESATLERVVERVLALPSLLELVIVDDGSTDGTAEIAERISKAYPAVTYVRMPSNRGKTAALVHGFTLTRGDIVVIQDADLELDPAEIETVIRPIVDGSADVVYGSRFMTRNAGRVLHYDHYLANKALTFISNVLTNMTLTDVETCYKAFRGEIIRQMVITSSGFGFEIESTAKIAKLGCSVYEVPITYNIRTQEEGKKMRYSDGFAALWYLLRFNIFCGIRSSYRDIPSLDRPTARRMAVAAGATEPGV